MSRPERRRDEGEQDDGVRAAADAYKGDVLRPLGATELHPAKRCPGCKLRSAVAIGYMPPRRLTYECLGCRRRSTDADE